MKICMSMGCIWDIISHLPTCFLLYMLNPLSIQFCFLTQVHESKIPVIIYDSTLRMPYPTRANWKLTKDHTFGRSVLHVWGAVSQLPIFLSSGTASRAWCWAMCLNLAEIVTIGRVFGKWMCSFARRWYMKSWMDIYIYYAYINMNIYIYMYVCVIFNLWMKWRWKHFTHRIVETCLLCAPVCSSLPAG